MAIDVGTQAPDFTLKSKPVGGDPKDVTLSANFGGKNTVLLFVPLAFTGVCTQELCDISAGLSAYSDLNADVIGISVDNRFRAGSLGREGKHLHHAGQRSQQEDRRRLWRAAR